ncbi:MAG: Ldh family oxidoreductase [Bacteroidia bacterium]
MIINHESLHDFIYNVFLKNAFPEEVAQRAAINLVKADLRGIDSHGVARLSGYIRLAKAGRINPSAKPEIIYETPSTATFDADGGLGLWTAHEAMKIAIKKAKNVGSGWVAVQNSSHFGIAAAHAEMALENDMIGLAMTNASPLVAPAGSKQAYLGTNPICVAIPAGKNMPFLMDLATAAAANGKLEIAQRKEKPIPQGWAQTVDGESTTDANVLKNGGTLLPLGSDADHGYHKGYGLGSWVDIFTGVLSGANFGAWVPPFVSFLDQQKDLPGKGIGHFVGCWRIDAFQPAEEFKKRMDKWIDGVKSLEKSKGIDEILIPGEPEYRSETERLQNGIPLQNKVWEDMQKLANDFSLELPEL